jgi:hypothetical protein
MVQYTSRNCQLASPSGIYRVFDRSVLKFELN